MFNVFAPSPAFFSTWTKQQQKLNLRNLRTTFWGSFIAPLHFCSRRLTADLLFFFLQKKKRERGFLFFFR